MKSSLLYLSLSLSALAQVYTPPGNQPAQKNTSTDTVTRSQPQQSNQGGIFGNELPFYNPSSEMISFNGQTWAASDNRLLEARFEKYLNEPEESSAGAAEYRDTIDQILNTLSPHNTKLKGHEKLYPAFQLLPRASNYPGDSKLCDSLSNAIYTAMLAKNDIRGTKRLMRAMEKEKLRLIADNDWKARHDKDDSLGATNKGAGKGDEAKQQNQPAIQPGRGVNSQEYINKTKRVAEIEALKKSHQLKTEVKTELAKIQYQALMVQFFLQRRFEHVVMASRFYNLIWRDGDGTLYLDDKSEINKLFVENMGVSPTVSSLDSLANEAMRDVDKGVEAFIFLTEREELESASKRLAESYVVGEFMPSIATLPREKKRRVLDFVRGSNVLLNAIQAKDYTTAQNQVNKLKGKAKDFDATKAQAAIAAFTRASDMSIAMAKNHMISGDTEKAAEEIKKAAEVWPQNPKLAEFDQLVESGGTIAQARNDFDRLFSEQNYREVFKRQYEFGPAIQNDSKRQEQFTQIIGNITTIERALEGAKEMARIGQDYAAWEKLSTVAKRFPDDPVLNQRMREMAPGVADFTLAIKSATEKENDGHHGSALAWYYQARHLHPASTTAKEGIKRLSTTILTK